jgi:hypothetical protein
MPTYTGTFSATVGASDATGTGVLKVTFTITPAAPYITASTATGTVGVPFSYTISATNNPTSYSATNLPPGLSISGAVISGTPNQAVSANFFATNPLAVLLYTPTTGPVANTAVTFTIPAGSDGGLATTSGGAISTSLTVNTNASGIAQVYYQAGNDLIATNVITASATVSGTTSSVSFEANCGIQNGLSLWLKADSNLTTSGGNALHNDA